MLRLLERRGLRSCEWRMLGRLGVSWGFVRRREDTACLVAHSGGEVVCSEGTRSEWFC